jgi:drug/metabolite transporter (DMT)-like permease
MADTFMKKFAKVLLSIVLGILAPLAFIVGGALFENTPREALAGRVAIVLYCATCQFWLPRKGIGGFSANWPILAGMIGGLLAGCAFMVEGGLFHNWAQFAAGCLGSFVGFLLSTRRGSRS